MRHLVASRSRGARPQSRSRVPRREWNCDWIASLAEPYLRGYTPQFESGDALIGYRFFALPSAVSAARPVASEKKTRTTAKPASAGFFIGYLLDSRKMPWLKTTPPEFLIFCFIEPVGERIHQRLVGQPDSLMRRTAEYIRWLTHHPPRFELFAENHTSLVRHIPISEWPAGRIGHYARNFTIETLAWLVRSALIRRLPDEVAVPASASLARAAHK